MSFKNKKNLQNIILIQTQEIEHDLHLPILRYEKSPCQIEELHEGFFFWERALNIKG